MFKHHKSAFLWSCLTILITACGPIYKTSYQYKQASSASGRRCIRQCLVQRTQCDTQCATQYNHCKATEGALRLVASGLLHTSKNQGSLPYISNRCTKDCGCVDTYNTCFASCGGIVHTHRQCTAFCHHGPKSHHD